ncbi:hypothetical protein ACP4OV_018577 [Aristida adscensionis]
MVAVADDTPGDVWRMIVPSFYVVDPLSGSPNVRTAPPIHEYSQQPLPAPGVWVNMEKKMMNTANERPMEGEVSMSMRRARIVHRFPHRLREMGGPDGRYVVPSVVAIGPIHHGLPHLHEMEELKREAAAQFCREMRRTVDEVYEKIYTVVADARLCYDPPVVAHLSDAQFATMMLQDGCLLLQIMTKSEEPPLLGHTISSWTSILKDIFLLENQIPRLVLRALMELMPESMRYRVCKFVRKRGLNLTYGRTDEINISISRGYSKKYSKSELPHLLSLLRFDVIHNMPSRKSGSKDKSRPTPSALSISAVDLRQKGVRLAISKAGWFADMSVQKKLLFGELSLSPLLLDDMRACWFVNLAALEAAECSAASTWGSHVFVVSSYLSMLAMLMDREEDVQELRRSGVLWSSFSDEETLAFFKCIRRQHLLGDYYYNTLADIQDLMDQRPVRIAVHKFLYNNSYTLKVALAVLSAIGVLVGIFRAFYPAKQS